MKCTKRIFIIQNQTFYYNEHWVLGVLNIFFFSKLLVVGSGSLVLLHLYKVFSETQFVWHFKPRLNPLAHPPLSVRYHKISTWRLNFSIFHEPNKLMTSNYLIRGCESWRRGGGWSSGPPSRRPSRRRSSCEEGPCRPCLTRSRRPSWAAPPRWSARRHLSKKCWGFK